MTGCTSFASFSLRTVPLLRPAQTSLQSSQRLLGTWCALLCVCLFCGLASAQTPQDTLPPTVSADELWLKLTFTGSRKLLDIVVAPFKVATGTPGELASRVGDIRSVFEADLRFSLYFRLEEPDSGRTFTFSTDERKPDLKGWATTGAQVLICGDLVTRRTTNHLELRLYDLQTARLIARKAYPLNDRWRWLAHEMADDAIRLLAGEDGVSRTRICFSQRLGPDTKELSVVDYDGADMTRLTGSGGLKLYPDWSPKGDRIAYCAYSSRSLNLYSLELTTRRVSTLADREGLNTTPAWSPDGRTIAASLTFNGQSELCLLDANGKNIRRLTSGRSIDISPSWSPNGRQLAFVSDRTAQLNARMWSASKAIFDRLPEAGFVHIRGRVENFQQNYQVIIDDFEPAAEGSFEIGDVDLDKERSLGMEAILRGRGTGWRLELSGFFNRFYNFIYLNPTGAEEDGLPVFEYMQDGARYWGFEAEGAFTLFESGPTRFEATALVDFVQADILGGKGPAPRIPPLRFIGGLEANGGPFGGRVELEHVTRADRVATNETETPAYTLVNASVAWRPFGDDNPTTLIASVNNILDVDARRHASFLKEFAPLPGRDFRLSARFSF
uniref:TonB-dependent receptor n=1 Tax=candidate division WOR-3 bacterium TaxID=2052148 RepID=A0A7C4GGP7_UNCW3